MAFCRYCGAAITDDSVFCTNCGVRNNLNVTPALERQGVPGRGQARASMILGIIGLAISVILAFLVLFYGAMDILDGQFSVVLLVYSVLLSLISITALILNLVSRSRGCKDSTGNVGLLLSLLGLLGYYVAVPFSVICSGIIF